MSHFAYDNFFGKNNFSINNSVAKPTFSSPAGVYSRDMSIALTTSGDTTYYTTNGTTPTTSSAVYSAPIAVASLGTTKTIKAFSVGAGLADSAIASATYAIKRAVIFDHGQSNCVSAQAVAALHPEDQSADSRVLFLYDVGDPVTDSSGDVFIDL